MKKIYILVLIFCTSVAFAQTTRTLKSYKEDKSTIVKDSTGKVLNADEWFSKVQSNEYTIEVITPEGVEPREFKLRLATSEEKRMAMLNSEKKGPITLAGFTTGKPIVDFSVVDINGVTHTKESMSGKVLVLNFWYKDAAPCKAEIPELNKLVKKYKGKKVEFLAPTYDPEFDVKEFLKKYPFNFTICTDVDQMIIDMKISKYPTHVVIDQQGVVQFVTIGQIDNIIGQLDYHITNLL
ncbi:MAG: peroxiredoxin family protein [bacterium]|jgi:peroxiredoxin